ncbi:MAG: ABC transporter substrate-binding protein [Paracoccus hibiscisoli]|uniref:ABC transporter substrate-binding protein n=1 Tax=Paracoccus hibiscisoli TaxID=2023261 RepID=UPI00391CD85C
MIWSDGAVLDAEDVAFSLTLGRDDPALDKTGRWADGLITGVEVIDPLTLRIDLSRPDTTLEWYLEQAHIVPEHIWRDVEDKITFQNATPVGSGPITEVQGVQGNQIEVCRNPHYDKAAEGLPYLDCIRFRQYSDNSQIQPALMAGEIDWGANFIADIDRTYVARDPDNHRYWYPPNDLINLYVNTTIAPFDELRVRRAMSMALDREMIVDLAGYGYPTVATRATGLGDYFEAWFNDAIDAQFSQYVTYDPDAANALLDEAGLLDINGDGRRQLPDGTPVAFGIQVVSGWTDWVQTAQMITANLADVGITATARPVDWSLYDAALKQGSYQASMSWSLAAADPIQTYNDYFHPDRVGQSWHAGHGMAAPELGALIYDYGQTTDEAARRAILDRLMTFTCENMSFIPLFSNPTWYQYNTSRIGGWPTAEDGDVQPVFYSIGRKLIVFERLYQK